jgi:hypothetical protein
LNIKLESGKVAQSRGYVNSTGDRILTGCRLDDKETDGLPTFAEAAMVGGPTRRYAGKSTPPTLSGLFTGLNPDYKNSLK